MPFGRNHYIAALEKRVDELQAFIVRNGLTDEAPQSTIHRVPDVTQVHSRPDVESATLAASSRDSPCVPLPLSPGSSHTDTDGTTTDRGDSMVHILRDLSLETNGGYIGATSNFSIGRLVSSIVRGKRAIIPENDMSREHDSRSDGNDMSNIAFGDIRADIAAKLFHGYMKHVATRYPVLQSAWIYDLHSRRDRLHVAYECSTLHLIYAIAGRFLETTGENNPAFRPEAHQAQVLGYLDEMLRYHDTRSVVTLLLLAVYSLRAEGGVGAWAYTGLAMVGVSKSCCGTC
jgi:hypothetical protein